MSDQASVPLRGRPIVDGFFEKRTSSIQYVVADPETKRCAIIDPVLWSSWAIVRDGLDEFRENKSRL